MMKNDFIKRSVVLGVFVLVIGSGVAAGFSGYRERLLKGTPAILSLKCDLLDSYLSPNDIDPF